MGTVNDVTVKMGRVVEVYNQKRHPAADHTYLQVKCEDVTGKSEIYAMFTHAEFESCPVVDLKMDLKPGRCFDYIDNRFDGYLVLLHEYNAPLKRWFNVVRRISRRKLNMAKLRKEKNPEDVVPTSLYNDLID